MSSRLLVPEPLTAAAFAAFGDVIEARDRPFHLINEGTCRRYDDVARMDVLAGHGQPCVSLFVAEPRSLPLQIRMMERHPLSSQAFIPLEARPYLAVVAENTEEGVPGTLRAFFCSAEQGINYARNTWHHPLIALSLPSRFLVLDRQGPGPDCEEFALPSVLTLVGPSGQGGD